jgi:crotonobetainyl-CoA:carnitine CoA-transferase CaiB-like acyl-CoA transferase
MSLKHIRVIDLTRVISGPFCTALLADFGADVIKVEPPGQGDPLREQGARVGAMSSYFANYNRNKRAITLDLYSEEGKAILTRLIEGADVVVENFRPDVMTRIGFSPERLKAINPDIIHCNINGFGVTGPYVDRPAFDFVVQAMSGFMHCNGGADDPPMRSGVPIADLVCGLYAALGILARLAGRTEQGAGVSMNVSMLSSLMSMLSFHATDYLNSGVSPTRSGNDHSLVAPYGLFATADGQIALAPSNDAFVAKLLKALDLEALAGDPRFASNAARMAHRPEINALIDARTSQQTTAHWIELLNKAGVPCGPVYGIGEAFADPQVQSQDVAVETEADGLAVRILGSPVKFDDDPFEVRRRPPRIGEHTGEVLGEAGFSGAEIAAFRDASVI